MILRFTLALLFCSITFSASAQDQMITARQHYAEVSASVASNHGVNAVMIMAVAQAVFGTTTINLEARSGKAEAWFYYFYSSDDGQLVTGMAVDHSVLGTFFGEVKAEPWPPSIDTTVIPNGWVDSDSASTAWNGSGLTGFFSTHPAAETRGLVLSFDPTGRPNWIALVTDYTDSLACIIDAVTTDVIDCGTPSAIDDLLHLCDFKMSSLHPNPASQGIPTQFTLDILRDGYVNVSVFDALGRLQGIVYDQYSHLGSITITIPSTFALHPGVYFIRTNSSIGNVVQKLIIVR